MANNLWSKITVGLIPLISQMSLMFPASAAINSYCQLDSSAIARKNTLREKAIRGEGPAQRQYQNIIQEHKQQLQDCRNNNWLKEQAIWLRLYPCDVQAGSIEKVLDQIVNLGYNTVYLEVFFDGQVLLPKNANFTPWPSVVEAPGYENKDLYAETLKKGRQRGLKMYAWLFSLNFGYVYSTQTSRESVLAINGRGKNSIDVVHDQSQLFVDPYNSQARQDYTQLLQAVLQRRPDGVLFDYIRYPRGSGTESAAGNVKDLWIYSSASRQALLNRGTNQQGRWLLERYIDKGGIDGNDLAQMRKLYPQEKTPLWEGRSPNSSNGLSQLQLELWYFTVAHAAQGVIDFLDFASNQVKQRGIKSGAVFFPEGNKVVGKTGFDSRLQPWDSFATDLEWHAMSYALCGTPECIVKQVQRVVDSSPDASNVKPVIAGFWGKDDGQRPSLESQMEGIRSLNSSIESISHFAYSWLEVQHTRERQNCRF